MPHLTAISASPAESPNTAAFINAIRAGYAVLEQDHGWAVGLRTTVVETCDTKPQAIKAIIKHHSMDRAVQLHYAAAEVQLTAPAVAAALTLLARRVEAQIPDLSDAALAQAEAIEAAADECLTAPMETTEAILAVAEYPTTDLREFTSIELDTAAREAQARSLAASSSCIHEMMRWNRIMRRLDGEVNRRAGVAGPRAYAEPTTRNQDLAHRRSAKSRRRW